MLAELNQIKTKDGLRLEGLLFEPKRKGKTIALWLTGLSGKFSHQPNRTNIIAEELGRKRISFAIFEHRGLGDINSISVKRGKKSIYKFFGTSFERFEESVLDIEAMIRFCRKRGYKKIFLFGHSTGANKAAYYILKRRGRGLSGVGLLGPVSDIPGIKENLGRQYKSAIETAEKMVKRGRSNELLPLKITANRFWSAARFLSVAREGMNEDTFPYYNPKRKFNWVKNMRLPVSVLLGSKDQFADRPISEIMESFRRQIPEKYFTGKIIKGANHGFGKREKELGKEMADWMSSLP